MSVEEDLVVTADDPPDTAQNGLEEDLVVTADGVDWLSTPQRKLWLVS